MSNEPESFEAVTVSQDIEVNGHIIDSLILPKVLDCITSAGGSSRIKNISVGQARNDPSFALVEVSALNQESLDAILGDISDHGAVPVIAQDCRLVAADMDGAFPEGFYSTTNQETEVRVDGEWMNVANQEMDCGIRVDQSAGAAHCVPMSDVCAEQTFVVGHLGVRVHPQQRATENQTFEFMSSSVSTEKPKGPAIRQIAYELIRARRVRRGKTLIVGGPAIVHTGSGEHFCELIRRGYFDLLFAGNALATHDI